MTTCSPCLLYTSGASEASWFSYNTAKNLSKHPEEFGHGSVEGVAAAESANNAVSVSYTHLDVYKRQPQKCLLLAADSRVCLL